MAKVNSNIDILVLSILNRKDCYTYEIIKNILEISDQSLDIKEGAIYPIIYNMSKKEYISSYKEIIKNRVRVYYKIEDSGKEYLKQTRERYRKTAQGIEKILKYGEGDDNE